MGFAEGSIIDFLETPQQGGNLGGPAGGVPGGGTFGGFGGGIAPPVINMGGGGGFGFGGGGGKNILEDPAYWQFREELLGETQGLVGTLEDLARQGKGLTEEEAQLRRDNIKRLLDLAAQQQRLGTQQQVRGMGNEAAARGSFMSQSRILGQQEAKKAEGIALQDMHQRAKSQVEMLNVGLEEAALQLQEQLARLQAQRRQAEIEHQIELLRRP